MRRPSAGEAIDMILALSANLKTQSVPISESLGRVLAEDIYSRIAVPPFDRSPFDGYAFRGEDTAGATAENPAVLCITEELPAGRAPTVEITKGHAAKILTGAPIPPGANATIKYELTEFNDTEVRIFTPVEPDSDIAYAGEDIAAGTLIAKKGDMVTPPHAGMLAGQGFAEITVFCRPEIAILNTGTELVEVGQPLGAAKIYNSNVYTLSGYLTREGALPVNAGVVADDPLLIVQRLGSLLERYDMVVTTGGASVGDYDWAERAAKRLGARVLFWKCAMKPGGSMLAAEKDGKLILSLSGNPGAGVNGLLTIGLPYIRKLCGRSDILPQIFEAVLAEPFPKKSTMPRYIRGKEEIREGRIYFCRIEGEGNGMLSPLVNCELIGEIPGGSRPLEAGERIRVFRI